MWFNPSYFRNTKKVQLSSAEKIELHEQLQAFMKAHPVRTESHTRQIGQEVSSNFLSSLKAMLLKPLPITLSALLLLGGGTAFAAERALPNEMFYPVKIQVNERVRAAFSPTTESQGKWEARVAERRLEELETLTVQNKASIEVRAETEAQFDTQAKLIQEKIAQLKAEGNEQAAIELSNGFQASLRTHHTILSELGAQQSGQPAFDPLLEKLKASAVVNVNTAVDSKKQAEIDAQAETKAMADKQRSAAATALTQAKLELSQSLNLSSEIKAKATTLIQVSSNEFAQGTEQFNQLAFKVALSQYEQADTHAREASALIKTAQTKTETEQKEGTTESSEIKVQTDLKAQADLQPTIKIDEETKLKLGL